MKSLYSALLLGALTLTGCTNLDETLYDKELSSEIPETTPTPPAEPIKAEEKLLTQEDESVNLAAEKKEKESSTFLL